MQLRASYLAIAFPIAHDCSFAKHDCFLGAIARNNPISLGERKGAKTLRNDELKSGFEEIGEANVLCDWFIVAIDRTICVQNLATAASA
jgi:hypothetical protein